MAEEKEKLDSEQTDLDSKSVKHAKEEEDKDKGQTSLMGTASKMLQSDAAKIALGLLGFALGGPIVGAAVYFGSDLISKRAKAGAGSQEESATKPMSNLMRSSLIGCALLTVAAPPLGLAAFAAVGATKGLTYLPGAALNAARFSARAVARGVSYIRGNPKSKDVDNSKSAGKEIGIESRSESLGIDIDIDEVSSAPSVDSQRSQKQEQAPEQKAPTLSREDRRIQAAMDQAAAQTAREAAQAPEQEAPSSRIPESAMTVNPMHAARGRKTAKAIEEPLHSSTPISDQPTATKHKQGKMAFDMPKTTRSGAKFVGGRANPKVRAVVDGIRQKIPVSRAPSMLSPSSAAARSMGQSQEAAIGG